MAQPEKRFKAGSCEAAVFENEIVRDGNTVLVKKVAIQKRYKDNERGIGKLCLKPVTV